jgi:ACS family hexuronate transporter-like MFS transporter
VSRELIRPERSSFRWIIIALLFAANAINYLDRQMIGLLKPTLQHDLGWSEHGYGDIVFWFQAAYAVGYVSCCFFSGYRTSSPRRTGSP